MNRTPKTDPMILAVKRAYRGSKQHRLDVLLVQELRWRRKFTIARNKHLKVCQAINRLALEVVKESYEKSTK